jgi:hypothetical protein
MHRTVVFSNTILLGVSAPEFRFHVFIHDYVIIHIICDSHQHVRQRSAEVMQAAESTPVLYCSSTIVPTLVLYIYGTTTVRTSVPVTRMHVNLIGLASQPIWFDIRHHVKA